MDGDSSDDTDGNTCNYFHFYIDQKVYLHCPKWGRYAFLCLKKIKS